MLIVIMRHKTDLNGLYGISPVIEMISKCMSPFLQLRYCNTIPSYIFKCNDVAHIWSIGNKALEVGGVTENIRKSIFINNQPLLHKTKQSISHIIATHTCSIISNLQSCNTTYSIH